jgi:acyl-coenzyme A thioesterase PaaI-like protein
VPDVPAARPPSEDPHRPAAPPEPAGHDGPARLRAWQHGRGIPAAVARLGVRMEQVGDRQTTVRLPLTGELQLPGGGASAAPVAMLADTGLTTAVVASLPDARAVTTVSMALDLVGPVPLGGLLVATCRAAAYDGDRPQHASGEVEDGTGRLVAVISGWFVPSEVQVAVDGAAAEPAPSEPPAPDVQALLALAAAGPEGAAARRLLARPALANLAGTLHGGVGALACTVAQEQLLGDGARLLASSFSYLRGVPRGSAGLLSAEVVRRGRRTAVTAAELRGEDGRVALQCSAVFAGRQR